MSTSSVVVNVGVRVRPLLASTEVSLANGSNHQKACFVLSETVLRVVDRPLRMRERMFHFACDYALDEDASQEDVYETLALPAVDNVLSGTNSLILTYGQTGSGKTYTILGGVNDKPVDGGLITSETGILLRALQDILHYASVRQGVVHTVVCISAVEIYLDEVRDLLSGTEAPEPIQVFVMNDNVILQNLKYVHVRNLNDALRMYKEASSRRTQRMTFANDTSSRSHAFFSIELYQQPVMQENTAPLTLSHCLALKEASRARSGSKKQPPTCSHALFTDASNMLLGDPKAPVMYSKLLLVDLAGSEKPKNIDINTVSFGELKAINSSLTALGTVVQALYEGAQHIPYRNAKLTSVLRDSLGSPNCHIVIIVTVSPSVLSFPETLSSLQFANKVKHIKVPQSVSRAVGELDDVLTIGGYKASLRCQLELSADLRIARKCYNFHPPEEIRYIAGDPNNILYDVPFHLRLPDSASRQMGLLTLCDSLKARGLQREELFPTEEKERIQQEFCDEEVCKWKREVERLRELCEQASGVVERVSEVADAVDGTSMTHLDATEMWEKLLMDESTELNEISAWREEAHQRCMFLRSEIEKTVDIPHEFKLENTELVREDDTVCSHSYTTDRLPPSHDEDEEDWCQISDDAERAIELSSMLLTASSLMYRNRLLSSTLIEQQERQWLYNEHIMDVWRFSMARAVESGEAAFPTGRRGSRSQSALKFMVGRTGTESKEVEVQPFPYWLRVNAAMEPIDPHRGGRGGRRTKYDDREILEDIASFMRMGGRVKKYDDDGSCSDRILYVTNKHGEERLCWAVSRLLGKVGYITIDSVVGLSLGCVRESSSGVCYTSWGISYKHQLKNSDTIVLRVNFVCESVPEFEAWVIGISHLIGMRPRFETQMSLQSGSSEAGLSDGDILFCKKWHIPLSLHAETRQHLLERQGTKGLRLTPGELCALVHLDIFRASAMWFHYYGEGLLVNPLPSFTWYVDPTECTGCDLNVMSESSFVSSKTSVSRYSIRSLPC
uniref:Putative kinesin n=1 Tax=Trypanosoma congolense (strain IL3000) TaxID=1068625 RepID=G0US71_TRYCI|nr:putative kinesin [Trypanosoma congolense IL3000]